MQYIGFWIELREVESRKRHHSHPYNKKNAELLSMDPLAN